MKRSDVFWGTVLLITGGLLLLDNLGFFNFLEISAWQLIWPVIVILLGVWTLWGATMGEVVLETQTLSIPREDAHQAHVNLEHGAGRLWLDEKVTHRYLMTGTFKGGVEQTIKHQDDQTLNLRLHTPPQVYGPWNWGQMSRDWNVSLSPELPLTLNIQCGASENHLNLAELQVTDLQVNTGASSTHVTLPAHIAYTRAVFEGGAAALHIHVPEGVAAQIRTEGAIYDAKIDPERFPRYGAAYQSPDYETAERRAEITIKMGVGSVDIT